MNKHCISKALVETNPKGTLHVIEDLSGIRATTERVKTKDRYFGLKRNEIMEKKTRKYYRVKIHRIPPYSSINGSYYYEEDVWAYSEDGARNKIEREHKNGYGSHIPCEVVEISKEEFRGDKVKES